MPTQTARLGLAKRTTAENFSTSEVMANWDKLDQYPGNYVCTSTTRPTWGAPQNGLSIFETDTFLFWTWNGTAFVRRNGKGLLNRSTRTSLITTTVVVPTYTVAVSTTVTVPAGGRSVLVVAEVPSVQSSGGVTDIAIFRDSTRINHWREYGNTGVTAPEQPPDGNGSVFDTPAAGSHTYAVEFGIVSGFAGTATLAAAADQPIAITVVEV